jgi:phosphonate transport system substrate-binding protein
MPVPQIQSANAVTSLNPGDKSLKAAISGVISPTKTIENYEELLTYIGEKLDREVELFQRSTYSEINDLIQGRRVDVAFVCSLAYVKGNDDFGMELLVVPQIHGETVYYSYLIVAAENSIDDLGDLRGASFAFTDPISNSGYLVPAYQLSLLDESPVSFFEEYYFTYSHDNAILAVADKLVDAAAVDSLVYDQMVNGNPELSAKTRVVARWGPYGIPPVVVSPALHPEMKQRLQEFFVNLHNSDEGSGILNNLGIDRFIIAADSAYDSIREMEAKLEW